MSVVQGVMMERGLSLFTVLGWKEVAVCDVKMERGLSLFIILRWKEAVSYTHLTLPTNHTV